MNTTVKFRLGLFALGLFALGLSAFALSGCVATRDTSDPLATGWQGAEPDGKLDIYGTDSRRDLNDPQVDEVFRRVADSTALVFSTLTLADVQEDTARLDPRTLAQRHLAAHGVPLCESERWRDEPAPGFCTAFLIADDRIATAGHCVNGSTRCEHLAFAFGFAKRTPDDDALTIPREDIYRCERIVGHRYDRGEPSTEDADELWYDWAVVQLDRPVVGRTPLPVAAGLSPDLGDEVTAVGHPSGLATKVTPGRVVDASKTRFFNTDLDIFGGNSGSPVVDASGTVRGIAVRGSGGKSFVTTPQGCQEARVCAEVDSAPCTGNHVLRPEPLLPFVGDEPWLAEAHTLTEGEADPQWLGTLSVPASGAISFATVNINAFAARPSDLTLELIHGDRTVTLFDAPQTLSVGEARWTRTTFDVAGMDASGPWTARLTNAGAGSVSVFWWQIVLGGPADLALTTPAPWIGSACADHTECPYAEDGVDGTCLPTGEGLGFCTLGCEGYCPDRAGHASTFCIAAWADDGGGGDTEATGICAVVPDASNDFCAAVPGTRAQEIERFVGDSGAPEATRTVCAP